MDNLESGNMPGTSSLATSHGAQLVLLAQDKSQHGRAVLTTAIVELFSEDARLFTDSDRELMTQIIVQLVDSVELSVKTALAERLASQPDVPRDLAMHFANMEAGVAFSVLKNSSALKDPDLIRIVMHKTMEHQMAVSARLILSPAVSRALAESEHDNVVQSLLENSGAEIDHDTFEGIAGRATETTVFNEALVNRHDLPKQVCHQLYWAVSAALRQTLIDNHDIDEDSIDDAIEDVLSDMIEHLAEEKTEGEDVAARVELAIRKGVLGQALLALLQSVQIHRFTTWLAAASHLREDLISRIMFEEGGECLAAIFKALEIDREDFLSIFVFLRQGRLGEKTVPAGEVQKAAEFYSSVKPDRAAKFLKRLQRNPDYLNAIRTVNTRSAGD